LEVISKIDKHTKRGVIYAIFIAIFISASLFTTYKENTCQEAQNEELAKDIGKVKNTLSNVRQQSEDCNGKIDAANKNITSLLTAIKAKGFYYDSANKELKQISVKSQFYMPDTKIMGGKNQFGNGNTQNN
jgi:uncharacterized protein HemX